MSTQQDNFEQTFSPFILMSIIGHISIVLIFTVKTVLFPSDNLIISQAIKVDMVALPDKKQPAKKVVAAPKPKKVVVKKPKAKPKSKVNTKSRQNKALERLKALEAIEKLKGEVNNKQKAEPKPKQEVAKGNVLSDGSSLTGLDRLQFDKYFDKLQQHVKEQWDLPQWLAAANLSAQVLVTIDERGYITNKKIVSSSGNNVFDSKVLETLTKSSPCPEPPSRLAGRLSSQGLIFNFP